MLTGGSGSRRTDDDWRDDDVQEGGHAQPSASVAVSEGRARHAPSFRRIWRRWPGGGACQDGVAAQGRGGEGADGRARWGKERGTTQQRREGERQGKRPTALAELEPGVAMGQMESGGREWVSGDEGVPEGECATGWWLMPSQVRRGEVRARSNDGRQSQAAGG